MSNVEVTLTSNAEAIREATAEAIKTALEAVGAQAQGNASAKITANGTVETGTLRDSIDIEVQDQELYVGTNVHYAPYIEFGTGIHAESGGGRQTPWTYQKDGKWYTTVGQMPAPFLRPAMQDHLEEYKQIFEEELAKIGN